MDVDNCTDAMDLKVRELLKEVELDYSPAFTKLVDETISAIKESIDKIPQDFKVTADLAPKFVKDIGADKVDFKFKKPTAFEFGGSYSIRSIVKPDVNVDLLVRMPKVCFHEKDYLNYRYHAKRCLYLCLIKKSLERSSSILKVEWSTMQNEARKPVLLVYPARKLAEVSDFFVRIIPTATSLFCISKLNLQRNNVRALKQGSDLQATPIYNSSVLEDMFLEDGVTLMKRSFLGLKEFREALVLLKVWARQRSSIFAHDCLNGFLISVILSFLISRKQINNAMKAMEIVRIALNFIATSECWSHGLYFPQQDGQNIVKKEQSKQFKELFPVIICNSSEIFNLAFRISRAAFTELQDEAALALGCLEKGRGGGFEEIFLTKIDYAVKYDYSMRLKLNRHDDVYASGFCLDEECWRLYERKVHNLLSQGFGERVKFIRVTWRNAATDWSIKNGFSVLNREPLLIGISVSSLEKAFKLVDMGPDAEKREEALEFRNFWGEKSELRRFKDGKIAESVVWETEQWRRHLILKNIAEHLLARHLSLSKDNIAVSVDQLDFSLLHGVRDPISDAGNLREAFNVLQKRLRLIQDIPLRVTSVQPLDSAFRYMSVFPPESHHLANEKLVSPSPWKPIPSCVQPLEVMIQLEGSGNWPMDEIAIEKTKSAFLLQIGDSLRNNWGMPCSATEDDVDVFMSGYAFRLKILHERGLSLLKKEVVNGPIKHVSSIDRKLFLRSQHASMIDGLQGRYPIYGPIVRLAKRWVSSHLFSACLVEEALELLVAHLFLNPLPFYPPYSRITGLLRFLRLLSEYDWTFSPLVVDVNSDLSQNDEKEIKDNFSSSREGYEENLQSLSPAMFLATAYDKTSEAWTRFSPSALELKRLVAYARSSANLLTKLIIQDQFASYRWECLFRTPLTNFDAVVLLHRDKLPYPQRLLFASEMDQGKQVASGKASKAFHYFMLAGDLNGGLEEVRKKLLVDFDPLKCLVKDLENKFSGAFKVWYDSLGGDAIGLTWDMPSSKKRGRDKTLEEMQDPYKMLKLVGDVGKGFVRRIYFLKAPRLVK